MIPTLCSLFRELNENCDLIAKDLTVDDQSARKLGADDFLPLLVYAVVHSDFIAADIETQYMDGKSTVR